MTFDTLGLTDSLLRAIEATGYTQPTPIQAQAIPAILTGRDVMAAAQTGTGKTAGFTLPLLQLLGAKPGVNANRARALILTPTRELAAQIQESIETYGKHEKLRSVVVFGGVNINPQQQALRKGADILVATPGRLLDLYQQNAVKFNDLEILVLDEADRMLDMGFIRDIRKILALLPKQRQNLLFSATFSDEIRALAKSLCHDPVEIDVAPRNSTVEAISQRLYHIDQTRKADLLTYLLRQNPDQTLVFSRTKHGANKLAKRLERDGITAAAIHGNKSQNQRTKALADFKANSIQVLVATDIAARGIDIDQLAQVINFDLPNVPEDYVHRIGRTGRAGATGRAISLVSEDESQQLRSIERLIKRRIEREEVDLALLPPASDIQVERGERQDGRRGLGRQGGRGQGAPRAAREGQDANREARRRQDGSAAGSSEQRARQERASNGQGEGRQGEGRAEQAPRAAHNGAAAREPGMGQGGRRRRRGSGKGGAGSGAPNGERRAEGRRDTGTGNGRSGESRGRGQGRSGKPQGQPGQARRDGGAKPEVNGNVLNGNSGVTLADAAKVGTDRNAARTFWNSLRATFGK